MHGHQYQAASNKRAWGKRKKRDPAKKDELGEAYERRMVDVRSPTRRLDDHPISPLNGEESTFKPVTSRSSICSVYYDQQSKRMQLLLCQDGFLNHEGELLVDDRKKLDKYEYYLESERRKLKKEEKEDLAQFVTRALSAVDHIKRSLDALKKSEACSIELDTLEGGQFVIDFLDENNQLLKKMGPFTHRDGFAQLTLSVENNWRNVGAFIIRKTSNTQHVGPFQLTDNFDANAIKNPIRTCRAAGKVNLKKLGSLQTSSNERYSASRDRRTVVKNLRSKESDACVVKLIMEFESVDPDTGERKQRSYQGTGSIINMQLEDGAITKCFIISTAHNFLQVDVLDETKSWMVACAAYLRMKGERDFWKKIEVKRYKVYDRYLELKTKDLGFQGVDFAIAAIDINPKDVAVRTFDSRFSTLPTNISELNPDLNNIEIGITGYSNKQKNRFQPLTMDGLVNRVIKKKGGHALLVYDNVDTSGGTDGAMIYRKQSASIGRNLGIHVGSSDGRSYGLLLTQPIMSWIYDTVTSGEFWEGSYKSPIQQPIGSWLPYDPYIDSSFSSDYARGDTIMEIKNAQKLELTTADQGSCKTQSHTISSSAHEGKPPVRSIETMWPPHSRQKLQRDAALLTTSRADSGFPLQTLTSVARVVKCDGLAKALSAHGYTQLSPVYDIEPPSLYKECPLNSHEKIRALIWSYAGVRFELILDFVDAPQIIQTRFRDDIAQTIVDFLGIKHEDIFLIHASSFYAEESFLEIKSTHIISSSQIGAYIESFCNFVLIRSKSSICSMYYDEKRKSLSTLLCQQWYLEHKGNMTTNKKKWLEEYKSFLQNEEPNIVNPDEIATINRALAAVEHIESGYDAKIKCVTSSIALPMLDGEEFAFVFYDENNESVLETGKYAREHGFLDLVDVVPCRKFKKVRSFKIIKYMKNKSFMRIFWSTSNFLEFGPYHFIDGTGGDELTSFRMNSIRSCRSAGEVGLKKMESLLTRSYSTMSVKMEPVESDGGGFPSRSRKLGAVLSVFRDRNIGNATQEVINFERDLRKAGYMKFNLERRTDRSPLSCTISDVEEFINEVKQFTWDGVFCMLIAHGYNNNSSGLNIPTIITEDGTELAIPDFIDALADTKFPVIIAANFCRTHFIDELSSVSKMGLAEVPEQVFLSMGSKLGKEACEHAFVKYWRQQLNSDFQHEPIGSIAQDVKQHCGGVYADGLDNTFACIDGIFVDDDFYEQKVFSDAFTPACPKGFD